MSVREMVMLGTGSQVPTRYRNHNGYFLRFDGHGILFDPGEGTQRQMIAAGVSATAIDRVCVTHFHGDHCLGLAGLIQRISLDAVPHEVTVHYPASGQRFFERLRYASIYRDQARICPAPIEREGVIARFDGLVLRAVRLDHGVPTYGYRLEERDVRRFVPEKLAALGLRGPVVGKLQREGRVEVAGRTVTLEEVSVWRPGQKVAVVMDTRPCPGALELARGVDLLVCEATYLEMHRREAHAHHHMTARQAAELAREAGAKRLVLTHFSQRYTELERFGEEAAAIFPDVVVARDGMRVSMPPR